MYSSYMKPEDRMDRLQDIASKLPVASEGDEFDYRGLKLQKASEHQRRRSHTIVHVMSPTGQKLETFDLHEVGDRRARKALDELRQEVN